MSITYAEPLPAAKLGEIRCENLIDRIMLSTYAFSTLVFDM